MSTPPRIPYRSASVLPPGIPPLNLFRMLAHSPSTLPHVISLGTVVFRDSTLPPYLRELVCLLNAKRLECEYQWKQHMQIARHASVEDAKIAALAAGEISGDLWSCEEKALLAFTDKVIAGPEVSDAVFDEARKHFSDQILVEVVTMQVSMHRLIQSLTTLYQATLEKDSIDKTITQGFYYSLARIATVFHVELEKTSKEDLPKVSVVKNNK
jgi:AhpD family alkylhydroperoxidase